MARSISPCRIELPPEVERAAELALARKATQVLALDLREISTATDYFVIGSGASDVQVRSIAEHIIEELESQGVRPGHVEGLPASRWILIDYFDFVVHVFHPTARQFYQLELLWGDAPQVTFEA